MQRWAHGLLCFSLWRHLPLRAVSPPERQRAAHEVRRHLARFSSTKGTGLITSRDMPSCSKCTHGATCTRCPGLAYMEGNMRGLHRRTAKSRMHGLGFHQKTSERGKRPHRRSRLLNWFRFKVCDSP